MAETTSTIAVYPLNGSNRRFTIPYEYLARRFISVTLMGKVGVQHKPLKMNSDFRFVTLNTIETTQAWGIQDGYDTIEIRRETSATDRLVEFADGSVLRSRDLNVSAIQTIHIAEEARNLAATTLTTNDDGNLDARGRKIVNIAPATEDLDAVNFGQVKQWSGSALNQADRAEREANRSRDEANKSAASAAQAKASENAAKASQTAAKASQDAAKVSQDAAKVSQTAAKASQDAAKASENAAKASQTAAKASQDASKTSENNAKASENAAKNAQAQAQKIADSVNENTDISKEQAEKAAKSATESAQSASASASSASKALASENAAKASQDAAKAAQDAAEVSNKEAKEAAAGSKRSETVTVEKAAEATSAAETARGFSDAAASSVEAVHEHVNKAKDWAENPVNEPVEGNMYSAKHWASVAQSNANGDNYLTKSGNLEELTDKEQARKNLGVPLIEEKRGNGIEVLTTFSIAPLYEGESKGLGSKAGPFRVPSGSELRPAGSGIHDTHGFYFPRHLSRYGLSMWFPYGVGGGATDKRRGIYYRVHSGTVFNDFLLWDNRNHTHVDLGSTVLEARQALQLDPLVPMGGGKLSYQAHELANQQDIESVENKITLLNDAKADNTKVDEVVESINTAIAKKADQTALNALDTKKADQTALDSSVKSLNEAIAKKVDKTDLTALEGMGGTGNRYIHSPSRTTALAVADEEVSVWGTKLGSNALRVDTSTGNLTAYGVGSFQDIINRSDMRLKRDTNVIEDALRKVGQLNGYTYVLTETNTESAGVSAQELSTVLPEAVKKGTDGFYGVSYHGVTALLVEAVKTLTEKVESLENKLKEL